MFIFDTYFYVKGWNKKLTCFGDTYYKGVVHIYPPTPSRASWYVTSWTPKSNSEFNSFLNLRKYLKEIGLV